MNRVPFRIVRVERCSEPFGLVWFNLQYARSFMIFFWKWRDVLEESGGMRRPARFPSAEACLDFVRCGGLLAANAKTIKTTVFCSLDIDKSDDMCNNAISGVFPGDINPEFLCDQAYKWN